jgi:hypothetical protein
MKAFEVSLPPGFLRFDLPVTDDAAIRAVVTRLAANVPEQSFAGVAGGIHASFHAMLRQLEADGCFLLFMAAPTSMLGVAQPMITFRAWDRQVADDPMAALMTIVGRDANAELVDLDPAVCVRTHATTPIDRDQALLRAHDEWDISDPDGRLEELDFHRVTAVYTLGVPGEPDSWFEAVCVSNLPTPAGEEPPVAGVLELFDGILTTFRWTDDA